MREKDYISLLVAGDIILGENPEYYFRGVKDMLEQADVRVGQLEVAYSSRAPEFADLARDPENMRPLKRYFDAVTLAGNHIYDAKDVGVEDTLCWLRENNLPYVGGGMQIDEARRPLVLEKNGTRIGFLNYNCVGPKRMFATKTQPGCAGLEILAHYDMGEVANPGGMPIHISTWPKWDDYCAMRRDIEALRAQCDVLCVYFHKGIVHKPVALADYERIVSQAAIEAGADVVFSSHSHILHGVEVYKGKTIYHGLGNFVTWVPSLAPGFRAKNGKSNDIFDPEEWARKRIERFGFVPDPDYPTYPFHPEAVYAVAAKCVLRGGKLAESRLIPMIVGKDGAPYVVGREEGGETVKAYLEKITRGAGLNAQFSWDGDEMVISEHA